MAKIIDMVAGDEVVGHRPWPRVIAQDDAWRFVTAQFHTGHWTLLSEWGDADGVHLAVLDEAARDIAVVSYRCKDGKFPSVGAQHAPAIRMERAIQSLFGFEAVGLPDTRPWLDLGFWDVQHPLGARRQAAQPKGNYEFLPVDGEHLHQIPVGPVHAGIIEPGHFRFTANGETVVRLEQRLGYVHKGIESLMAGADLGTAAKLAARTSGDSTVAYSLAFAHAVEAALDIQAPPRARYLRALMAELERLANHFGDIGAVCNDASFSIMHAQCGILRERVLRAANACFGHRLMMDRIVPGGTAEDIQDGGPAQVQALLDEVNRRFPELIELYENTASLQDRTVTTGIVRPELVRQFAPGGYVGRASGRSFDVRKFPGYAPYDALNFDVPVLDAGDVNARVQIRIREVEQSLGLIAQILQQMPDGPIRVDFDAAGHNGEGLGLAEAFRGDVLIWLRIAQGRIARCHLRDASWFQWPLLEAAIEGNIVADFPLCNKSFNCSYSGHDL